MSEPCATPLGYERFLAYWSGELGEQEQERLEAHLLECDTCGKRAERFGVDTLALQRCAAAEMPRSVLTRAELQALGGRAAVVDVPNQPRLDVRLRDKAIHVFRVSLDPALLRQLERLDVEYVQEATPEPIFFVSRVPLDETGEVLLACHSHVLRAHGDSSIRFVGSRQGATSVVRQTAIHFVGPT